MEESSELSPPFTTPPFTSGADTSITDVEVVQIDAAVTTAALTPIIIQNVAQSFREPESRIVQDVEFQNDSECVDGVEEEVGMVVQSVEASDPSIHGLELRMGNDGQVFMAACLICGDRASGYHYSVLSCEGCKGFFKRTVQKNLMYTCKDAGKGSCVVNKSTRNNCQFCRYNKCLQHGMRRDAVREDRSPGGKHRVKRPRLEDIGVVDLNKKMEDVHLELIEKLMEAHPDRIPGSTSDKSGDELTIEELMQYGYVELRFIIEWAKQIPYFRDFGLDDQMAMLKSSFMELNVLRLSYRSVAYDNRIKFAESLVIPVSTVEKMGWGFELVQSTVDFAARLKELNMDHAEFCIMCAIVLTYPDAIGIVDKLKVTSIQTRYLDVLRRYIYSKYPHSTSRYGKLLLRLPTLRTLSAKAAERFLSLTLEGVLHINDLVQEMIN